MKRLLIILFICATAQAQYTGRKPMLGRQVDWSHPLSKGLVGLWLFNEGSGDTVTDLSGNGNNGTFAVNTPDWVGGKFGHTLNFVGSNPDYITLPAMVTDTDIAANGLTLLAWCRWDGGAIESADKNIICLDDTGGHAFGTHGTIYLVNGPDGAVGMACYEGGSWEQVESTALMNDGGWHQVVGVFDAGTMHIYLDGNLVNSSTIGSTFRTNPLANNQIGVASDENNGRSWTGPIDHAIIWNRALATSEITKLYYDQFCFMADDDVIMKYVDAGEPPETTSQVIMIQMGAATLGMALAAVSLVWLNRRAA